MLGERLASEPERTREPASVSAADRQTMERIGVRNFQDAANSLPGVIASAPSGPGGYVAYRGFNSAQIGQLFNGINLQYSGAARPVGVLIYDCVEPLSGPSSISQWQRSSGR